MKKFPLHFEQSVTIPASPAEVFDFINDHKRLSSHMNKSSWMMGGGSMHTEIDEQNGQAIGSHIKMEGTVLGMHLYLNEVVTKLEPPKIKEWQTVGDINLLVIGHYSMGMRIDPENQGSKLTVYLDYELDSRHPILGKLFHKMYAKWCTNQMAQGASDYLGE